MMQNYLEIDGSIGKGGGQVLRSALALFMGLGKPFTIYNIRRDRRKPGLRAQHLCAVRAAAQICGARLKGAEPDSTSVGFEPGPVKPGEYEFFIDGGGSCTLVLQAILPPLLTASAPSRITVHGATHNPLAPPFEYFDESLRPQLEKLGPRINARLNRHGFASHGGGSITVEVEPVPRLREFSLLKGGWSWEHRLQPA